MSANDQSIKKTQISDTDFIHNLQQTQHNLTSPLPKEQALPPLYPHSMGTNQTKYLAH